jgi:hypothetical protein
LGPPCAAHFFQKKEKWLFLSRLNQVCWAFNIVHKIIVYAGWKKMFCGRILGAIKNIKPKVLRKSYVLCEASKDYSSLTSRYHWLYWHRCLN